jgi:hypothetical protein
VRRALGLVAALALAFGAITGWALEGREVIVLRTFDADAAPRETRVWVADADGALWVEAASPERAWYRELLADPRAEVVRGGRTLALRAEPQPPAEGHERIRALLRAKYGWADAWVGLLQDTSGSLAVRLVPRDDAR